LLLVQLHKAIAERKRQDDLIARAKERFLPLSLHD
jgi:hypothetical protein